MSYVRFVWYRVRRSDGVIDVHRWIANPSPDRERWTLDAYHRQEGLTLLAGPFRTRRAALAAG